MGDKNDAYDRDEAQRRFEQAVKVGLNTPPLPKKDCPTERPESKRDRKEKSLK